MHVLAANGVSVEQKCVSAGGKAISANIVRVPLDKYQMKVGLAQGRVGATDSLKNIVGRYKAVAGINGCFFDAYTKDAVKPPYHHLITGGEVIHLGNTGTTLGFDANGDYRMDQIRVTVRGEVKSEGGRGSSWYAYFVNHPVQSGTAATIFNRYYVGAKTPAQGTQIVIRENSVQSIGNGGTSIPSSGFALLLAGGEQGMAGRFQTGANCSYRYEIQAEDSEFWQNVREAVGCGPMLVRDGQICLDPTSEGFSSAKILTASGQRSAVGITSDRKLLLVTCGGTVRQLASVMKALGCRDAMNLDGGASSCLYANGKYLTSPGRNISNALLVVAK